jgi:hypothetical protein
VTRGQFGPFNGAPTLEFDNSFGDVLEDVDYSGGGTRFNGSQTGPLIGVTQRF